MSTTATRRNLTYATVDAIIADVQSLRRGYTKCGNWTLPQICWHLTTVMEKTGRPATEPATAEQLKMRPILEQILAQGRLPRPIEAPAPAVPPAHCDDASIDAFIAALQKLSVYPEQTAVHRVFGPLTADEYLKLSLIHSAHHLSHLTATA